MNEHEIKNKLNESSSEIPTISADLKNKISTYVLENKDLQPNSEIQLMKPINYMVLAAVFALSISAWLVVSYKNNQTIEIEKPKIDYEEIFSKSKIPEITFPTINTPKIKLTIPNNIGDAMTAFLDDKKNNPYEQEIESISKLSKRIMDNFSDELMLNQFALSRFRSQKELDKH